MDFEFTVCLLPMAGRLLALMYTEQPKFKALWDEQPWRREYGYWNNTYQPEDVTNEQWAERERTWKQALPGHDTPAETGYTFTLLQSSARFLFASDEDVDACIPTLEQRAKARLVDFAIHKRSQAGLPEPATYAEFSELRDISETARTTVIKSAHTPKESSNSTTTAKEQ